MAATVVEVTLQGGSYDVLLDVGGEHLRARVPVGSAARPPKSEPKFQCR